MRLIDVDAFKAEHRMADMCGDCKRTKRELDCDICDCCDWLDDAPTVGEWISVKDRLPPDDQMVIGYTPVDGYMFVGFHKMYKHSWREKLVGEWFIITAMRSTRSMTKRVTHWMPLPEPPEVKQNDGV